MDMVKIQEQQLHLLLSSQGWISGASGTSGRPLEIKWIIKYCKNISIILLVSKLCSPLMIHKLVCNLKDFVGLFTICYPNYVLQY